MNKLQDKSHLHKRMFGLDILRSIAILSVLLGHSIWVLYSLIPKEPIIDSVFVFGTMIFGFFGVEIFFVLSGFLIGSIFIKEIVNASFHRQSLFPAIRNFWLKRWFRTLPNFYLFLLLYLIIGWMLSPIDISSFSWKYILFVQNFFSSSPGFFFVAWSLAVEEWFYLLLPVLFTCFFIFIKNKKIAFLLTTFSLFIVPFVLRFIYVAQHSWSGQFSVAFNLTTIYRLDSIAYGIALAWLWSDSVYKQKLNERKKILFRLGLCSFILTVFYLYLFVAKTNQNGLLVLVSYPWATLSISLCFPMMISLVANSNSIVHKLINFISKVSYSLYLIHPLVIMLIDFFIKKQKLDRYSYIGILTFPLIVFFSFVLAFVLYRFWELPFLSLRDKILKKKEA